MNDVAVEIAMPRLSDSMEEGTVLSWMVAVGDRVEVGQEIVEIETDKANMAYEAEAAGIVLEIRVGDGETASVGATIAVVGEAGAEISKPDAGITAAAAMVDGDERSARSVAVPTASRTVASDLRARNGTRVKASPLARRIAAERGVDLSQLVASGPGGRIVKADVENAALRPSAEGGSEDARHPGASAPGADEAETAKGAVEIREPDRLQQVVARRMSEAKATAPHFYLSTEIEMTKAVEARRALKETRIEGIPSFNDMVIKAAALALREFPKANGAYKDGRFELYSRVNVGVAVASPGALVVPTVFDAERKGLGQIAAEVRELAAKVRDGRITPPELSGATFTVSNLGMYGISDFEAVINLPQAAILAVGAIQERPLFKEGVLVPAQLMKATISCDHRILYGAEGAELLARVRELLEEPVGLAL